ncbi:hypothetical protein MTO96_041902, partial [Rhipicephalus appendiculatus]
MRFLCVAVILVVFSVILDLSSGNDAVNDDNNGGIQKITERVDIERSPEVHKRV